MISIYDSHDFHSGAMTHILAKRGRVAATVNLLVFLGYYYYQQINYLVT